ncbi:MAG: ABC transporter permease [Acidimicrobiaceae bacterium]|nr:ABC transporter permease [Acidimicrobiaceae bacterium]MCY3948924.1 ABC transporter permease [Acidimicrobiaceae bacterium]
MSDFFTVSVLVATLASGIRLATPFLLSALGETIGQRAGVLNLGVEGVMLIGAYAAYITALRTGSVSAGVLAAIGAGAVMGMVYAFITVVMHATQGISGIGIFLFGLGFTDLLFRQQVGTPVPIDGLRGLDMGALSDLPIVGELLFSHNMLTYVAFALVPVVWFAMNRTTFGLNVRAVGETPEAADTLGVRVNVVRTQAIIIGNVMAGLAGGTLALDVGIFQQNLTSGQGFIAVALVYFGAWRSSGVMAGALLFGVVSSTVLQLKTLGIIVGANSTIAAMAPAILTIVVLVLVSRRIGAPSALTVPFERDN